MKHGLVAVTVDKLANLKMTKIVQILYRIWFMSDINLGIGLQNLVSLNADQF